MTQFIYQGNVLAGHWAPLLWRASWQGGLFIAAVWIVCRVFRRMPASTRHWLWWLASAQLMLRLVMASPIALPVLPANAVGSRATEMVTAPIRTFAVSVSPPVRLRSSDSPTSPAEGRGKGLGLTPTLAMDAMQRPVKASYPTVAFVALTAWIVGIGICLVAAGRRLVGSRRFLVGLRVVDSDRVLGLVDFLSRQIGVRPPLVRESAHAPCPLLAGWIRPTIVLPSGLAGGLSDAELRMALAHELTHLRRRDLWVSLVPVAAQILFFFHPLAWLSANEAAAAREEDCDTEAMRLGGGSPATYARLLLNSAQSSSSAAVMGAAFGYRLIQRRITMLSQSTRAFGTPARRAFSVVVALGVVCALPWTVTAQSAAAVVTQPAPPATHHKKLSAIHAKHKAKLKKLGVLKRGKLRPLAMRAPMAPMGSFGRMFLLCRRAMAPFGRLPTPLAAAPRGRLRAPMAPAVPFGRMMPPAMPAPAAPMGRFDASADAGQSLWPHDPTRSAWSVRTVWEASQGNGARGNSSASELGHCACGSRSRAIMGCADANGSPT